jgi:hypothetical protein
MILFLAVLFELYVLVSRVKALGMTVGEYYSHLNFTKRFLEEIF